MFDLTKWATSKWNLILKKCQLSRALKNTCVLSNYECYNHNISKF
jgi:hypothetical protein